MLIVTRNIGQGLIINGNIQIVAVENRDNKMRIGINAPHFARIEREEVFFERLAKKFTPTEMEKYIQFAFKQRD